MGVILLVTFRSSLVTSFGDLGGAADFKTKIPGNKSCKDSKMTPQDDPIFSCDWSFTQGDPRFKQN